jgi:glycosyltransferase involved in cell wall biosynthesis
MAADIVRSSAGLFAAAWTFGADAVFVPDFLIAVRKAPALVALRLLGRRVVLRVGMAPGPGRFYRALWRSVVSPSVDRIVCNSEFIRCEVLATGVPAGKVVLIRNCVATRSAPGPADVAASHDPWKVVYIGQIIPPKGLMALCDAIAMLRADGLPVTLDVVGDLDRWEPEAFRGFRARVRARAERPDLAGAVRFLGAREDVPALLAAAAVHCCPSAVEIREGMAGVVLEAKAAGIPSVVTASGSLPELVEHRHDGWVGDETPASIAEGLRYFLADPAQRQRAGRQARESLARFDRDSFARAWRQEFMIETGSDVR